jgi:hypothetical protein
MTNLKKLKLGTDPQKGWPFYAMHLTSSYILKDFFLIDNYKTCISLSENHYKNTVNNINFFEKRKKEKMPYKDSILANAKEISSWTEEMKQEEYHDLYVHSFIGIWSSFEAGLENCFSDFIENDRISAENLSSKFKPGKYNMKEWPWSKEFCMNMASKLDLRAKQLTENSGIDYFKRLKTIFSWLNIEITIKESNAYYISEANRMRNIILHRNGVIDSQDVLDFPLLKEWENSVMPFNGKTFNNYYNAITEILISIMNGTATRVKEENLIEES